MRACAHPVFFGGRSPERGASALRPSGLHSRRSSAAATMNEGPHRAQIARPGPAGRSTTGDAAQRAASLRRKPEHRDRPPLTPAPRCRHNLDTQPVSALAPDLRTAQCPASHIRDTQTKGCCTPDDPESIVIMSRPSESPLRCIRPVTPSTPAPRLDAQIIRAKRPQGPRNGSLVRHRPSGLGETSVAYR